MRKLLVALAAFASLAGVAHAAETNFYLGAGIQEAHLGTSVLAERNSTGLQLYGGYRISPNFAVELGVNHADGFRAPGSEKLKLTETSVSLLASYPVFHGISAFGRLGAVYQDVKVADASFTGTNPLFGLGVQYDVNKHWALRAEGDYLPRTADSEVNQTRLSVGVQYGF